MKRRGGGGGNCKKHTRKVGVWGGGVPCLGCGGGTRERATIGGKKKEVQEPDKGKKLN